MKNLNKFIAITLLMCMVAFTTQTSNAQSVGYINSNELLSQMPEVKQARANLETLANQLKKRLENQITELQNKAANLDGQYKRGELSPAQAEAKQVELQKEQQVLAQTEQDMSQQVVKKEQELLQPILDRFNGVVEQVAKENGYSYVFDTSQGSLLYFDPAHDLGAKVKAKL